MELPQIDGLLLDMDGVLGVSWRSLPGAVAAVARLRDAGLPLRVITNTTAKSRGHIGAGLRAMRPTLPRRCRWRRTGQPSRRFPNG